MLNGNDRFLFTMLLKLSRAVNGHFEHYCVYFVIKSTFHAIQCSFGGPYGLKELRNVLMVMKCFVYNTIETSVTD